VTEIKFEKGKGNGNGSAHPLAQGAAVLLEIAA
jgi:hypothetical protein